MKILLLDNHDSFTFTLAEWLRRTGKCTVKIVPTDKVRQEDLSEAAKIVLSPGPGLPQEQPAMFGVLEQYGEVKPVLGVCLGHQAIALYYGGELFNLGTVVHGQPSPLRIIRPGHYLFKGIAQETPVGLYHSWAVREETLPACLEILALNDNGLIMALGHRELPVCGIQFHPESIITREGLQILNNWINHPDH